MAKTNRNNSNSAERSHEGLVCCRDCVHAQLLQYDNNPVLAQCLKKPDLFNERFPYDIDVASSMKACRMHLHTDEVKPIEKRVSVRRHPMACCVRSQVHDEGAAAA